MTERAKPVVGVSLSSDIEYRPDRPTPYKARVRWVDLATSRRRSLSESTETAGAAEAWIDRMRSVAAAGVDPDMAVKTLHE